MTMSAPCGVLRDVAVQAQTRVLLRPGRPGTIAPPEPATLGVARPPAPAESSTTPALAAGYAEGFETGLQRGRQDGEAQGLQAARARRDAALQQALDTHRRDAERQADAHAAAHEAVLHRLERLLAGFQLAAAERLVLLETDAVALAFEALCRLLGSGYGQPEPLAAAIAEALRTVRDRPVLRVRVRPDGLQLLADSAAGRALMASAGAVEWVADPRVEGEGCVIDNDLGSIDARLDTQLGRLRQLWSAPAHPGSGEAPAP